MRAIPRALLYLYDSLVVYLNVIWLGVGCLAWSPFALIFYPLLSERRGRALGRKFMMLGFRSYIAGLGMSRRFSFDIKELDALRDAPPLIIAPNHPCLLDAVMVISRLPNVSLVLKTELMDNIFLGAGARLARFTRSEPVRAMMYRAIRDFECGSHLLLFPEGTRTTNDPINPLKGSIGVIARRAQVPVQTVLIETDSHYMSKGWSLFRKPPLPIHYRIRLGRRFDPPQNTQQFMKELEHYFANELVQGSAFHAPHALPAQADCTLDASSRSPS